MTTPALCGPGRFSRMAWTASCLALGGLVLGLACTGPALAQKKKTPAKTSNSKTTKKKTTRPEAPKIVDVLTSAEGAEQVAYINELIRKKWEENKLTPSPRCSDYEFIRRASLDLIGRIAKPAEIHTFLADPPEKRRSLLIDRLLDSEEYARNWANIWSVWLLTRGGALNNGTKIYHEQMKVWLEDQFANKDLQYDKMVNELLTASGKTNENGAVNFILAHLGEPIKDDPSSNGKYNMVPITSRSTRLFLGLRIQCTQCHDHPFNDDWKQSHFWGVNAFFRQVDAPLGRPLSARRNMMAANRQLELVDNPDLNPDGIINYERRNGVVLPTKAVFLDGTRMPALGKGDTRRKELAKFILKSDYFAKAYVNRMWAHFFGRGFTKTVDDFGEHNPVSHPELLDRLAKDFKKYNYRVRDLTRWICNSEAYGLSSAANETNDKEDAEPFFSRMLLKAMTPEQLFDSLMVATGAKAAESRTDKEKLREQWMARLVVNFGDDEGNEQTFNGTVVQALLLMNGKDINDAITDPKFGTVAHVVKTARSTKDAMRQLYMAALNRPPTAEEYRKVLSTPMMRLPRVPVRNRSKFYMDFYQDLYWALLNSNEFLLNH